MFWTGATICVVVSGLLIAFSIKRRKGLQKLDLHSISPDELYAQMSSKQQVLLFDVRQPLDLLGDSEIITGATRVPPRDLLENPSLIPKDKDAVVYCTCPDDKTSRSVLQRAQALQLTRVKFLKGGLRDWKARGYPVERYDKPFHLDTRT
jgi:rhodanese-related sulfurtransferase